MRNETANVIHAACYIGIASMFALAYREPIIAIIKEVKGWYNEQLAMLPRSINDEAGAMWDDVREAINNG